MKHFFSFFIIVLFLFNLTPVWAQTPAAKSPTPTGKIESDVEDFKEKIESKVAELVKKKRAISGHATSITSSLITLKTEDNTTYRVKLDKDVTTIYRITGTGKREITAEDLEKGAYLIVSGPVNDKEITANGIYEDTQYGIEVGTISEVDKAAFVLRVVTKAKEEYLLDIESGTTQSIINSKTFEVEKIGFSKIKEGDSIQFIIEKDAESVDQPSGRADLPAGRQIKTKRYTPTRILIVPTSIPYCVSS